MNKEIKAVTTTANGYTVVVRGKNGGTQPGTNPIHANKAREAKPATARRTDGKCAELAVLFCISGVLRNDVKCRNSFEPHAASIGKFLAFLKAENSNGLRQRIGVGF
jgi:hypothetical protein